MMSLITPDDVLYGLSVGVRARRIAMDLTQVQLSERANVSLSVLRTFERTGKISLKSFVKLSFILECAEEVLKAITAQEDMTSLDDLLADERKSERKYAYSPRKNKNA